MRLHLLLSLLIPLTALTARSETAVLLNNDLLRASYVAGVSNVASIHRSGMQVDPPSVLSGFLLEVGRGRRPLYTADWNKLCQELAPSRVIRVEARQKLSRRLGANLAAHFDQMQHAQNGVEPNAFALGMADRLAERQLLVSGDEAAKGILLLRVERTVREQKKRESSAAKSLEYQAKVYEDEAFLAANARKPGVTVTSSGLQYRVLRTENKGRTPKAGDFVKVHFKVSFPDGTLLSSSETVRGTPVVMPIEAVMPGWIEGLFKMREGDRLELVTPPHLADPRNAPHRTLLCELELLQIANESEYTRYRAEEDAVEARVRVGASQVPPPRWAGSTYFGENESLGLSSTWNPDSQRLNEQTRLELIRKAEESARESARSSYYEFWNAHPLYFDGTSFEENYPSPSFIDPYR